MTNAQQRNLLLEALQRGPVSVNQARHGLGIDHPEKRVFDMRRDGFQIVTLQAHETLDDGTRRRASLYVLLNPAETTFKEAAHA